MTLSIESAYRAAAPLAGQYAEPFSHVERVNHLRQQYRPAKTRLLIVGESHVRRSTGPGFIYDAAYYTPWWRDLLWPAFGGRDTTRAHNLEALRERGVWLLDMSVLALSGYRNVHPHWPARPLDACSAQLFALSWQHFIEQEFRAAACAHVVYFERAAALLPERVRLHGTPLRFNSPRPKTALPYHDSAYRYGTARFLEAVRKAGL